MPTGFQAGSAYSIYSLDLTQFDRDIARIKRDMADLQKSTRAPSSSGASSRAPEIAAARQVAAEEAKLAQIVARTAEVEARREAATARKAETDARASLTAARQATEEQRLATEIAKTTAAQERAAQVAQRRQQSGGGGAALPRTFAGFTAGGFNQALGAFGLATLGPQLVGQTIGAGIEAGKSALELDRTLRLTKELTGTQGAYNDVLKAAREQQRLYGGSLQDNIAGIQGLVVTARSTGAELQTLIQLSQRLAVLDPAQGAEGARIALSEVLSGDPRSLSRRYEIPLQALEKIKDTSTPVADRLKVLDDYLNKIGISAATVNNVVTEQAKTYNQLGTEIGDLTTKLGQRIADNWEAPAEGLGRLIGLVNGNPEAIAKLQALMQGKGSFDQSDIDRVRKEQAQSTADQQLSPGRTGDPFASDATRKQADMLKASADAAAENAAAVAILREQLTALNLAGGDTAARAQELANQWQSGAITADQFRTYIQALTDQQSAGADMEDRRSIALANSAQVTNTATAETLAFISGLQQSAEASQIDAAQKEAQQAATELMNEQARFAVDTFLQLNPTMDASAAASAAAAAGYSPQIQQLIVLAAQARATKAALDALAGGATEGRAERDTPADRAAAAAAGAAGVRERAEAAATAKSLQILATGTTAQKRAELQKQYNDAVALHGKESAEAINAQTKLLQLEQQGASGRRGARGRGNREHISDQQRLNNQLLADQQRANDRYEAAERDHARNLLRIERDYQAKSLEQQKKNEIDKRQSELSFLEKLTGSSLNKGDAQSKAALQQINQDYYAAYDKAQQIAQAGNAQLADEYLKLKQEQYEAEIQYQEQLEEARKNKDAGEIARLQALEAKRQAIYAEREKQLLEGGDANKNARDEAIRDENARYEESQGKIADSADRAAERKITAAQRAGKAIDDETAKLQKQQQVYDKIAGPPSAAPSTATPAPANTSAPGGDAQAAQLLAVADAAVLGAIQSQTAMQIDKFDTMIGRLDNVERAVRSLRSAGGVAA